MKKTGVSQGGGVVPLDIYTRGDNEQPTTCPKCGCRTDWEPVEQEDGSKVERHECLGCSYEFIIEEGDGSHENPAHAARRKGQGGP